MWFKNAQWTLEGHRKRIKVRLSGDKGPYIVSALFDTGASKCVFSKRVESALFNKAGGIKTAITGVGGEEETRLRKIKVEVLSDDGTEVLLSQTQVEAFFVQSRKFDLELLGVETFLDKFCWKLDYPGGTLSVE